MKSTPNIDTPSPAPAPGLNRLVRFWACFFLCLLALGIIAGLMLAGFFGLMGYRVF